MPLVANPRCHKLYVWKRRWLKYDYLSFNSTGEISVLLPVAMRYEDYYSNLHQSTVRFVPLYSPFLFFWGNFIGRTYGVVIFNNEPLEAGVIQLHESRSLECIWVTPTENGSLPNTTTTHVLTFISHAGFCFVSYVLFLTYTCNHFVLYKFQCYLVCIMQIIRFWWSVTGEFPSQRSVMQSFDVSFFCALNWRLSKQPWGWWLESSRWLWRHCNDVAILVALG